MAFFNMAFLIYLLNLPLLETLIFFNFLEAVKPSAVDIWERMVLCHFLIISFINSWALNFQVKECSILELARKGAQMFISTYRNTELFNLQVHAQVIISAGKITPQCCLIASL